MMRAPKKIAFLSLLTFFIAACGGEGESLFGIPPSVDGPPLTVVAPGSVNREATSQKTLFALDEPTVSGGDGNYTITNDAPVEGFSLGQTNVLWTVRDGTGTEETATQLVTLSDTTPPTVASPNAIQIPATGTLTVIVLDPPTASDLVDIAPIVSNDAPASGFPLGTTIVRWTATDASGNSAIASQSVIITDISSGSLTLTAPADVAAEATAPASQIDIGTPVAAGGQGQLTVSNDAPVNGFPVGTTNVTWTVMDAVNTMVTANQQVVVNDTTAPTLTIPADVAVDQDGDPTPVDIGQAMASDIADPSPTVTNNAPSGGYPVGTTVVIWTAADASGNQVMANQSVVVNVPDQVSCASLESEFSGTIYPILDTAAACQSCHTPPNVISTANGFNILANDTTGFELFRTISAIQSSGESIVLVKALGGATHGGGNRFTDMGVNDPNFQAIEAHINKLETCVEEPSGNVTVERGSGYEQLYKLTTSLASRPPRTAEADTVAGQVDQAGIDSALNDIVDQLLQEDAFYVRLMELYNDVLLTDRLTASSQEPNRNFSSLSRFANGEYFADASIEQRKAANYGITKAPLQLIRYVVENNRPFTEILTADYLMVNPYSATLYGVDAGDPSFPFSSDNIIENHDRDDFRPVTMLTQSAGESPETVPLAGVVSTHAWLNRYQSTATNVNRHRARMVFLDFLGIDIEGLAPRDGLDLDNVIGSVPTYEDPQCTVCHDVMDPVAGLFLNRRNGGGYESGVTWGHELTTNGVPRMLPPGYTIDQTDELPSADYSAALPWFMSRLAQDDRFATHVTRTLFEGFTRIEVTDPATTAFITNATANFVGSGHNLRVLVKDIILSDYFLASNLAQSVNPNDFPDTGAGRLLTPEELNRKIAAVVGEGYGWRPDVRFGLLGSFRTLYGGITSGDVVERITEPNAIMDGIQELIANQVACERVALELRTGNGNLFPHVSITDAPDSAAGAIRDNIRYLHRRLLGEDLAIDDSEIDATYQLFVDVWNENLTDIPPPCRGGGGGTDTNGTIIPWTAVLSYLISDYHFFYE